MKIDCHFSDVVSALCDDVCKDSMSLSRRKRDGDTCTVIVARGKLDAHSFNQAVRQLASMCHGLDTAAVLRAAATDIETSAMNASER